MLECHAGQVPSSEHSGDFLGARVVVQRADDGVGPVVTYLLGHAEVAAAVHGNLGKVSDTEYLVLSGHAGKLFADGVPHLPAHVRIDFVEHEDGNPVMGGQHGLDGEHHAGDFAARRDGAKGPRGFSHVGSESKRDFVRPARPGIGGPHGYVERAVSEPEIAKLGGNGVGKGPGGGSPGFPQGAPGRPHLLSRLLELFLDLRDPFSAGLEVGESLSRTVTEARDVPDRLAVLPLELVQRRDAVLDPLQPGRITLDPSRGAGDAR